MFWEVSGIGTEVIVSWVISFLDCTLWVTLVFCLLLTDSVSCSSVSCFRVWFLTVVSDSNTQDKTPPVPGSTITLVSSTGSTYVARWFG